MEWIVVVCPRCAKRYRVRADLVGRQMRCPCGTEIIAQATPTSAETTSDDNTSPRDEVNILRLALVYAGRWALLASGFGVAVLTFVWKFSGDFQRDMQREFTEMKLNWGLGFVFIYVMTALTWAFFGAIFGALYAAVAGILGSADSSDENKDDVPEQ